MKIIYDQVGKVFHFDTVQNSAPKVYLKVPDPQVCLNGIASFTFSKQHSWIEIEKLKTEIAIQKSINVSISLLFTRFRDLA